VDKDPPCSPLKVTKRVTAVSTPFSTGSVYPLYDNALHRRASLSSRTTLSVISHLGVATQHGGVKLYATVNHSMHTLHPGGESSVAAVLDETRRLFAFLPP
ncbi:unnamed protein product, partial [Pylaiella littoralis]